MRGIDGELYICDKDIFERSYDIIGQVEMTEEKKKKLIKKWEPLLNAEISSNATVLLIEPMETPFIEEV
jgi:hypothetical protein